MPKIQRVLPTAGAILWQLCRDRSGNLESLIGRRRDQRLEPGQQLGNGCKMRQIIRAACGLWLGLAGAALAQSGPVVVELYTSQGCSSCPPADALLADLAAIPEVMPLALHVDYWDYIGWKDRFAQPHFTDRQKAYARAARSRMIYTPQMIVGGVTQVEGTDAAAVMAAIARQPEATGFSLTARRQGDSITILAEGPNQQLDLPEGLKLQLVNYLPSETVAIEHGENAGHVVEYRNIVTSWSLIGEWDGAAPLALEARAPGDGPAVVILQYPGPGPILATARVE